MTRTLSARQNSRLCKVKPYAHEKQSPTPKKHLNSHYPRRLTPKKQSLTPQKQNLTPQNKALNPQNSPKF